MEPRDVPILKEIASKSPFPYPDPESPLIEACYVVVDESDRPIAAVAAERIVQAYLWMGDIEHPAAKLCAIRMLQECAMRHELRELGYNTIECFLPPKVAKWFGRRIERLGACLNWPSWAFRL